MIHKIYVILSCIFIGAVFLMLVYWNPVHALYIELKCNKKPYTNEDYKEEKREYWQVYKETFPSILFISIMLLIILFIILGYRTLPSLRR
jgi:hypothetical protein